MRVLRILVCGAAAGAAWGLGLLVFGPAQMLLTDLGRLSAGVGSVLSIVHGRFPGARREAAR